MATKTMTQAQATARAQTILRDTAAALNPRPTLEVNDLLVNVQSAADPEVQDVAQHGMLTADRVRRGWRAIELDRDGVESVEHQVLVAVEVGQRS